MTALIIVCSVIFALFLIGSIRAHLILRAGENFDIYVKVLFINLRVFTTKKAPPPDPELDLPPKKTKKKREKQKKKKSGKESSGKKMGIADILDMVKHVVFIVFKKLKKYLRVRVHDFYICVASSDAATTAIMFGAVCGSCSLIFELLESAMDFKTDENAKIGACCDYLSDKTRADINVDISITVGQTLKLLLAAAWTAVKRSTAVSATRPP